MPGKVVSAMAPFPRRRMRAPASRLMAATVVLCSAALVMCARQPAGQGAQHLVWVKYRATNPVDVSPTLRASRHRAKLSGDRRLVRRGQLVHDHRTQRSPLPLLPHASVRVGRSSGGRVLWAALSCTHQGSLRLQARRGARLLIASETAQRPGRGTAHLFRRPADRTERASSDCACCARTSEVRPLSGAGQPLRGMI
jgi:hypothetical protein